MTVATRIIQRISFPGRVDPPSISAPLAQKLQECNKKAEEEVLAKQENADLTEQTLLHAVAVFSRRPAFKLRVRRFRI